MLRDTGGDVTPISTPGTPAIARTGSPALPNVGGSAFLRERTSPGGSGSGRLSRQSDVFSGTGTQSDRTTLIGSTIGFGPQPGGMAVSGTENVIERYPEMYPC